MLARLFRITDNQPLLRWPLLLLGLLTVVYGGAALFLPGGNIRQLNSTPQFIGTLFMFALMPCYLIGMMIWQRRRILAALEELQDITPRHNITDVQHHVHQLAPWGWALVFLGFIFGGYQNIVLFNTMQSAGVHPLDLVFATGNCLLWATAALLIAWRFPTSLALYRLGAATQIDLYQAQRLRPLARIATTDVLIVTGALAMTPLQALDAEFRLQNYSAAFIVGIPVAAALFLSTLWGAHTKLSELKSARQRELEHTLDQTSRNDFAILEPVAAHLERIRTTPTWPIDLKLLTRVMAYVVLPPLAWVAAALVENLVDQF